MITLIFPTKKLFRRAFYTSPLIAALITSPFFIRPSSTLLNGVYAIIIITLFIFTVFAINIGLIYLTEKYKPNRSINYVRYILSYAICISLAFFVRFILMHIFSDFETRIGPSPGNTHSGNIDKWHIFPSLMFNFCLNTVILIIQDLIMLREKQAMFELENAQLKIKNIEATNQQLRQQIHPHFLFNSLNTLKNLIKKRPEMAEEYLVKLSDFLRSSISPGNKNVIKVEDELKISLDYLEMQKIRFNDALKYAFDIPGETGKKFLPSFSLQLLVENAIKHNALTEEVPLQINVRYKEGRIIVSNNVQKKQVAEESTGIGLANLAERYKIISGDELIINPTEDVFSVSIKVLENESSNHRG